MTATDDLTPRQRLAKIVAEETDGGRRVVRFFTQVADGELDHEGFQPNHRMDAAKELVKMGLTQFADYIEANASPPKPRKPRREAADPDDISPEVRQAREELARYARELTDGGRNIVRFYSDVMDGVRHDEGFKPHHRIGAAQKLVKIGFPETEPAPVAQSQPVAEPSAPVMYHPPIEVRESTADVFREILSPDLIAAIESDDPIECPCMNDDECEDCVGKERGCPYADLEFPEFSEDDSRRIKESASLGLRRRAEAICEQTNGRVPCPAHRPPDYDP